MENNILSTIGHTPLVMLSKVVKDTPLRLYAKLEAFNPGGSMKDRAALIIIKNALEKGRIGPGTTVIESSSGNMGIGLAQVCAYFGLRFICVVDPKTTKQNIAILQAFGAEIDLVSTPDHATGEYLPARINRIKQLEQIIENSFWPDQYSNPDNALAHQQTMREIALELDDQVDYLFCATSTCGTIRGCAEYIQEHGLRTKIFAVDALGSVIFGGTSATRLIPGHGAAVIPKLYRNGLAEKCIHVSDLDCIIGCRRLIREEAIFAGGSSGAVFRALDLVKDDLPAGSTCVMIFPDRGERYVDTIYSDEWVTKHFGDIEHLWKHSREEDDKCKIMMY